MTGPPADSTEPSEPVAKEFLPDSTVRLAPIGSGGMLLEPGATQQFSYTGTTTPKPESRIAGAKSHPSGQMASPYGCVMSTPNLQGKAAYRYESVYAFFPEHVVKATGAETRKVVFQMNSRTAYSSTPRPVAHVLRRATCRIPDTDTAERLVRERLGQFPRLPSAHPPSNGETQSTPQSQESSTVWSGVPDSSSVGCASSSPNAKGLECAEYTLTIDYCVTVELNDGTESTKCYYSAECTTYEYVLEDDSQGGGGGDDGNTGSFPSGCNADGGTSSQLCGEGGTASPPSDLNVNPCDLNNPPDYCDEAGSCFDKTITNENDRAIILALETKGALNSLWKKSNADAADQSKREERGGWIVSTDDGYKLVEFGEVQSGVEYTPIGIRNVSPGARPSGTVATFHTQPFEPDEIITDTEVIQQFLDENNLNNKYDAESVTATYPSEVTEEDFATSNSLDMKGYVIDGSSVYSYNDVNGVDTAVSRCGY